MWMIMWILLVWVSCFCCLIRWVVSLFDVVYVFVVYCVLWVFVIFFFDMEVMNVYLL